MQIDLMITCDCGISNFNEVEFANKLGLDVIVTDHHSIPKNPPPSIATVTRKPSQKIIPYIISLGLESLLNLQN